MTLTAAETPEGSATVDSTARPSSAESPAAGLEQPEATLPLPNWLATLAAVAAVGVMIALPFALDAGNLSWDFALDGYFVQSSVLFAVLGAVILARRPGHVIGWLLVAIGGFDTITRLVDVYLLFALEDFQPTPTAKLIIAVFGWTWVPSLAALAIALPLLFPDGRLLSRRWRSLAVFGALATVLLSVAEILNPLIPLEVVATPAYVLLGVAMLASLVPLGMRFRRSSGVQRQQFKWVFFGLAFTVPLMALGIIGYNFGVGGWFTIVPFVVLPVTITVAVLRYRLYDIDLVINKTVVFVVLAAFITSVYAVIVVGLGRLLPIGEGNLGLAIAATALVAVAFEPVRVRVQHGANRLVYGRRASPYEALAAMSTQIGESADPDVVLAEVARLLAAGTGAGQAVVWVAQQGRLVPREVAGTSGVEPSSVALLGSREGAGSGAELPVLAGADLTVPVRHEGQLVGALSLTKRPGEGLSSGDRRLVEELAGQAALLLANTRLRARLTDRMAELRASRQRMLAAQDRARHALERDLHDGAQQELVALKIRLGLATTIATREGATSLAAGLAQSATVADQAVDTLRDVARGIYPPLLESEGLASALSAHARRVELAVTVLDRAGRRYPREVEATAYFCALEALNNAVRHASAQNVRIELEGTESALTVTVSDDGCGFDPETTDPGSGHTHMTDRIDCAGGALSIASRPGKGATVMLRLPVSTDPGTAGELADQIMAAAPN